METVYALQEYPTSVTKTLFLAGPTPRLAGASWRDEALKLLEKLGYDGHVFIPEPIDGEWAEDYQGQVDWEHKALARADVIAFWVPRDATGEHPEGNGEPMPGFTTNDEWGVWKDSGKVVWGSPTWAESTRYQKHWAKRNGVPTASTLEATLKLAVEKLGEGAHRSGGASLVPLYIWRQGDFQAWYQQQFHVGNKLVDFSVALSIWAGPQKDKLVLYAIQPTVWIASENREKAGEVVVLRSDISAVCLFHRPPGRPVGDTQIVLVREYRVSVRNVNGYVWEFPGGSSSKAGATPLETAVEEVSEEVGLKLSPDRLTDHGSRQMGATLVGYHAHMFSAELTAEEMAGLHTDQETHGADDEERVTLQVRTIHEVLEGRLVDWPMLGMIFESLVSRGNT